MCDLSDLKQLCDIIENADFKNATDDDKDFGVFVDINITGRYDINNVEYRFYGLDKPSNIKLDGKYIVTDSFPESNYQTHFCGSLYDCIMMTVENRERFNDKGYMNVIIGRACGPSLKMDDISDTSKYLQNITTTLQYYVNRLCY